jgi:hypothetical protein
MNGTLRSRLIIYRLLCLNLFLNFSEAIHLVVILVNRAVCCYFVLIFEAKSLLAFKIKTGVLSVHELENLEKFVHSL